MTLPLLLSVPHAGLVIPAAVQDLCVLSEKEIIDDGDEGASAIYLPLQGGVSALVTTSVFGNPFSVANCSAVHRER